MRAGLAQPSPQRGRIAQGNFSARPQPRGGGELAGTLPAMAVPLARLSDLLVQASDALRGQGERLSHKIGLFKLS